MTQNLWDAAKAVLREKLTAVKCYLKKQENHQIDSLTLHIKQLEKGERERKKKKKLKMSRRKDIIKIRAEM